MGLAKMLFFFRVFGDSGAMKPPGQMDLPVQWQPGQGPRIKTPSSSEAGSVVGSVSPGAQVAVVWG